MRESRVHLGNVNPAIKGAVLGVLVGIALCAGLGFWAYMAFDLEVSSEQSRVTIPEDLKGQRFDRAAATLQAMGIEDVRTPGAAYYYGVATRVEAVVPTSGTEVEKDSTVTLIPRTKK